MGYDTTRSRATSTNAKKLDLKKVALVGFSMAQASDQISREYGSKRVAQGGAHRDARAVSVKSSRHPEGVDAKVFKDIKPRSH